LSPPHYFPDEKLKILTIVAFKTKSPSPARPKVKAEIVQQLRNKNLLAPNLKSDEGKKWAPTKRRHTLGSML
jgi:hypothetical protein